MPVVSSLLRPFAKPLLYTTLGMASKDMQTMADKKTLVAEILQTREHLVKQIEEQRINVLKLSQAIRNLAELQAQIMQSRNAPLAVQIKEIDFLSLENALQKELETLTRLQTRFMRKTLNFGVIGRARQGKSRLLRSMSGLSEQEIPTGKLGACTGVRSTIMHNAQESYAQIFYYTEREFLDEVLALYYKDLQLGPVPGSIDQFAGKPLPVLSEHFVGYKTAEAKYEHLKRYKIHIAAYRDLIDQPPLRVEDLRRVREYVAQLTVDGRDLYNHYAVKEVQIFCPFPYANDVEQIAFIDMPGLGDTGIGDEERLLKALGEDLDIALVVRKPAAGGDLRQADTDLSFYDTAQKPLQNLLPFHKWAFLVLNRTEDPVMGDNFMNCKDLQAFINASDANKAFVDSMIVDCSKPDAVNTLILEPVLRHLLENIRQLDEQYVRACQDGLQGLQAAITAALTKAAAIFSEVSIDNYDHKLFQKLFEQTWEGLMDSLVALLKALEQKSATPDPDLHKSFEKFLEVCRSNPGLPPIEEIRHRHGRRPSYESVYYEVLDEIRVYLTANFVILDNALENSMKEVKKHVAKVFLEQGQLQALAGMNEEEFFQQMAQQLENLWLKNVFRFFDEYQLSYRGFFQQRILRHMSSLKPDYTSYRLALPPSPSMSDDAKEKAVVDTLKQAYAATLETLRQELFAYLTELNLATFMIAEKFVDQAMRAWEARSEWSNFYYPRRPQIWEADFRSLQEWKRRCNDWVHFVSLAQEAVVRILPK